MVLTRPSPCAFFADFSFRIFGWGAAALLVAPGCRAYLRVGACAGAGACCARLVRVQRDDIDQTLQYRHRISEFAAGYTERHPWMDARS